MKIFRAWLEFLARQTRPPEDSKGFRALVAVNVTIAILAVGMPLEWPGFVAAGLLLTWGATFVSYRFRRRNNWDVKAALSVLMVVALGNFFYSLSSNVSDPRIPLAELLVYLQALHTFDLPGRRDLNYSLLVACILMSIAAVMSVYATYGIFLGLYALTAWLALHVNYRRALAEVGVEMPLAGAFSPLWSSVVWMMLGSALVLLCLPRFQSFRIRALPMSLPLSLSLPRVSSGKIHNAAFPATSNLEEFRKKARFDPDSYSGFNAVVDLQMRGRLSSDVVMHVRCSRASYLRALAFDSYAGQSWTQSRPKPARVRTAAPPLSVATEFAPRLPDGAGNISLYVRENVQIIYVEKALPNLVLAAYEPSILYFPSEEVYRDKEGCILSPYPLESGTVYSVISSEVREVPQLLKGLGSTDPRIRLFRKYLSLPPGLAEPGSRVGDLALRLTRDKPSPYLKVLALVDYLHRNYRYNVDVAPYPGDADSVDYFLFVEKEGYCEQFASALAVMSRCIGLPSRYVTGYLPGAYNPLTGYHEIRGNDAHAWTEIWIPNYGWLTFDGTPPGASRLSDEQDSDQSPSLGLSLIRFLVRKFGGAAVMGVVVGLAALLAGRWAWAAWQRSRVNPGSRPHFLEQAMVLVSPEAPPGETPRQLAARVSLNPFDELCRLHEDERYAGRSLSPEEVAGAERLLGELGRL